MSSFMTGPTDTPVLDPQMAKILARMQAGGAGAPKAWEIPIEVLRERAREEFKHWNRDSPPVERVEQIRVPGAVGQSGVRIYYPADVASLPGMVYFHGGGWVLGDLDLEDAALRTMAAQSGAAILSVDYALAPEHPFPVPLDDCVSIAHWIHAHASSLGIDPDRLAVGGASAGGNLALSTAIDLRDSGRAWPRFLLLTHGVFAARLDNPSMRQLGGGDFGLSRGLMDYFWRCYVPDPQRRQDPRASPLHARLEGLPPVYLNIGSIDPLLDDPLDLRTRLQQAGVPVQCDVYPGVIHGFPLFLRELDVARTALRDAAAALRAGLA
jgi:acetyl esterase